MKSLISKGCGASQEFKLQKQHDGQRLRAGLEKFREAMISDEKTAAAKKSALPADWRNRLLK